MMQRIAAPGESNALFTQPASRMFIATDRGPVQLWAEPPTPCHTGTLTGLLEELDRSPACYSAPLLGRVCCGSLSSVKRCKHSYCAGNFELKISQLPIDTSMATKNNANASRGQNLRLQLAKRIGRTLKRP